MTTDTKQQSKKLAGTLLRWLALSLMFVGTHALAQSTGTVTYVYTDPQGTPLAEADASGNITATFEYTPYGTYAPQGTSAPGPAPKGPGYTGHVNDPETNLVYMQARYYDPVTGRFLSRDPIGQKAGFNDYDYADNNPIMRTDPTGLCADHYENGSCKVNVDPSTGKAGTAAGKQLEGVLNKYDKAINALADKGTYKIRDTKGKVIGSMSGKEIKAVWNGTSFTVTNKAFDNGGAGGGTAGTWKNDSFSGKSELMPQAIVAYANAAVSRHEAPIVGLSTLTFHELGHETHFGEDLTEKYPVTSTIAWPREWGASSAGARMTNAVKAPFDCAIPGGCQ